ncbi:uncharacterized protein MONBRDRAFT_5598 [Monosiga brevicollis MX1]|uniref:Uncharacterized protein n=1 Tax=Monosiga brevicollis TaxID=81824 RepID=A9URX3_MONBE|nr:uncharacterized protein MONBRDRAFT_5598 [Monosiga brevicollis MX1]EDQ91680.1 predicted protein [Monosiga brevicollis MX1]|eukprot:XP_001742966.1 hypothetical protein [Monosiga brevicollis MX1]
MQFIDADAVVADSTQMTDLPEQPTDAKGRPIDPTDVLPDEPMKQAPRPTPPGFLRWGRAVSSRHSQGQQLTVLPHTPPTIQNISTFSGPQTNCMIHLYRGELGKMVAYRIRLDTSTNWAVSTTSVLTVLAMGDDSVPHYFFAFILFINTAFLLIEARRYQIFLASRARVRILESVRALQYRLPNCI